MISVKDTQKQEPGDTGEYPWDNGGKLPTEYTWEEFCALGDAEQEAFYEWFYTPEAFEAWMMSVKDDQEQEPNGVGEYPWDNGGKLPTEYTWEEFCALSDVEQEAFFEWFDSPEMFEVWMNSTVQTEND